MFPHGKWIPRLSLVLRRMPCRRGLWTREIPYAVENRMKAAGTPDPQTPEDAEVSALAMTENEMAVEESETGAAAENAAKDLQASEETVKSPLETGSAVSEAQKNEKSAADIRSQTLKNVLRRRGPRRKNTRMIRR